MTDHCFLFLLLVITLCLLHFFFSHVMANMYTVIVVLQSKSISHNRPLSTLGNDTRRGCDVPS